MKYLEIVKKLQDLSCNIDVLVLVRSGIFFYGVGRYKEIARHISSPISETREHFDCNKCQYHSFIDNKVNRNKEKMKRILNELEEKCQNDGK